MCWPVKKNLLNYKSRQFNPKYVNELYVRIEITMTFPKFFGCILIREMKTEKKNLCFLGLTKSRICSVGFLVKKMIEIDQNHTKQNFTDFLLYSVACNATL